MVKSILPIMDNIFSFSSSATESTRRRRNL
jgi:hypothetical protein